MTGSIYPWIYKGHRGSLLCAHTLSSAEVKHLPGGIDGPSTICLSCLTPAGSQTRENTQSLYPLPQKFYPNVHSLAGYKFKEPTWVQQSTSFIHFSYLVPLIQSLISVTDVGLSAHAVLTARLLFDTQEGFNCFFIH